MKKNKKNDFGYLKDILPEFIVRSKIQSTLKDILPFVYSTKTMEMFDRENRGPKKMRVGKKLIVYKKNDFIDWLENQITPLN